MNRRRVLTLGASALALVALLCPSAEAAFPGPATSDDFAGRVAIPAGRELYLECHGSGSPTVVFEAGLRGRGDIWEYSKDGGAGTGVLPLVTPFTRTCTYDRPGTLLGLDYLSRSDPVPMPRTTGDVVTDLHELLYAAGVPQPYVFVGASTGGLIGREYASRYPAEVAGLVLVDAINEAVQGLMKPKQFARYNGLYLQSPAPELTAYRDLEAIDFYRSFAEMRQKRLPSRTIPVAVLSNDWGFGIPEGVTPAFARLVNRVWKRAQRYLVSLQKDGMQVIALKSGHQIALNRPELVAQMTVRVIDAVRGGYRLTPRPKPRHRHRRKH